MKAMIIRECGGPEVFERAEIERPAAGAGEVVIDVRGSSVNPVDWKMRNGFGRFLIGGFPAVLHPDCAGIVAEVGEGVTDVAPGDAVYSFASGLMGRQGALAEFMPADARMIAKAPKSLPLVEAATLPLVAVTAFFCLTERVAIPRGAKILIQGGTGGVGSVAIQIARHKLDVEIYATCGSDEKCRIAEQLGADRAYNRKTGSIAEMVEDATGGTGFDVVFNTPGASSINASVEAAAFGGSILDINGAFPTAGFFQGKQLGFLSVFAGHPITHGFNQDLVGRFLSEATAMVDAGKLRPLIDRQRFSFARVGEAHDYQENGHPVGKVALEAAW